MAQADISQSEWDTMKETMQETVKGLVHLSNIAARHEERIKIVEKILFGIAGTAGVTFVGAVVKIVLI